MKSSILILFFLPFFGYCQPDSLASDSVDVFQFEANIISRFEIDKKYSKPLPETEIRKDKDGWAIRYSINQNDTTGISEGNYKDGRKFGIWKYTDHKTGMVKSYIEFKYNRPNGDFLKYGDGKIYELGIWKVRFFEWRLSLFESGCKKKFQSYKTVTIIYKDSCDYGDNQVGSVYIYPDIENNFTFSRNIPLSKGSERSESDSSKSKIPDGDNEKIVKHYIDDSEFYNTNPYNISCSNPEEIITIEFDLANGENKLYNVNNDLVFRGEILDKHIQNGNVYCYDSHGLLTRIIIIKNGKYFGEGVMDF